MSSRRCQYEEDDDDEDDEEVIEQIRRMSIREIQEMGFHELRTTCSQLGIGGTGTKQDLLDRLMRYKKRRVSEPTRMCRTGRGDVRDMSINELRKLCACHWRIWN